MNKALSSTQSKVMNQGYVSTAAPSPADHVKAGAANMSGSVWVVGTGWRHRFLCHAPPPPRHPRHVQGPAKVLASQGAPNSFFPPRPGAVPAVWFAAARGTAAVQRARARRLYSPRARRQHCSSTASWCGLQLSMQHCSTGHNEMLQSARPSIAPTCTAYIRTKYLYCGIYLYLD